MLSIPLQAKARLIALNAKTKRPTTRVTATAGTGLISSLER